MHVIAELRSVTGFTQAVVGVAAAAGADASRRKTTKMAMDRRTADRFQARVGPRAAEMTAEMTAIVALIQQATHLALN